MNINYEEYKTHLTDNEKYWTNQFYRWFYGNPEVRISNQNLAWAAFLQTNINDDSMLPSQGEVRNIIHFIRNEILPVNAGKVLEHGKDCPESYMKGNKWLVANSKGYMFTSNVKHIEDHIETLKSRMAALKVDLESANLVKKAILNEAD